MENINYWWAILNIDERDYILGWNNWIDIDNLPKIESSIIEYNQLEFKKQFWTCLCTTYAWLGMFSNNSNKKINSVWRLNHTMVRSNLSDFNKKVWWLLSEWVKSVIDVEKNWIMYRIHKSNILKLINKWYTINIWIYVWEDLKLASSDWIISIEEIQTIKDKKRGHSTLINANKDWQDSYVLIKEHNITKLKNLESFINSWVVYDWAYLIVPNNVIKEYFKTKLTWNAKKDLNMWVELMKAKKIYPREFVVYQELMKETYLKKTILNCLFIY